MLALDLGTKLGWALLRADGRVESGRVDFTPRRAEGEGMRFLKFRAWLHEIKRRIEAAGEALVMVRYEVVNFIMEGQAYAAHVWGALWGHLLAWCEYHGIAYRGFQPATIKKAATGSGRASKPEVAAAMRQRGYPSATSDEADALALLLIPVTA